MEERKSFSMSSMLTYLGSVCAFAIGSGFASGQELMQYYTSYGWQMFLVGGTFLVIFLYTNYLCSVEGKRFKFEWGDEVFHICCGKKLGAAFGWFVAFFCFLSFIVMLAGAGSTLNQQYGIPVAVGAAVMAVLAVLATYNGLSGVVNIIGKVGPVIIVLVLFIAVATLVGNGGKIPDNIAAIQAGEYDGIISKVGNNWLMSGMSYGGFVLLWFASFMANLGSASATNGTYKELLVGQLIGAIVYIAACWVCAMALASQIGVTAGAEIPNLILAGQVWKPLATIFAVIIYAAIFSTACPLLHTATTAVYAEGTTKYHILAVGIAVVALVVAIFVPYQGLVNVVYGFCGYVGAVLFVIMIVQGVRWLRKHRANPEDFREEAANYERLKKEAEAKALERANRGQQ